jgi:hypothetical protein
LTHQELKDGDGRYWKLHTKCKYKKSQKVGVYQLSHFDADHVDNFGKNASDAPTAAASGTIEGNLASVSDPSPFPPVPIVDPLLDPDPYDLTNKVTFLGVWCTSVNTTVSEAFECRNCHGYFSHPPADPCPMAGDSISFARVHDTVSPFPMPSSTTGTRESFPHSLDSGCVECVDSDSDDDEEALDDRCVGD